MAPTTEPTLAIYADIGVKIDPDRAVDGPYFIVEGFFSAYDPARLNADNNPEYVYFSRVKGLLVRDLTFKGQCSRGSVERAFSEHGAPYVYGHQLEFAHGGDLEELKEKVQTLKKLGAKLSAMYDAEGPVATAGQQIGRYFRAMGINLIRFTAPGQVRRIYTRPADAIGAIDAAFSTWCRTITAPALEAEAAA